MATTSTSSKPNPQPQPIPPKFTIIDSIPTISISTNSVIRKKVTQCLSLLQIPTQAATTADPSSSNATAAKNQSNKKTSTRGPPKIIALTTGHPSAGSKAITIAEIVKRCIADTDGDGVWWQYTKLESKLVELPPRKPILVKEDAKKKDHNEGIKEKGKGKGKPEAATANANKRKQDGPDSRASKRPKLDPSQSQNTDSQEPENTTSKPNPKKRRYQTDGIDQDSNDDDDDDIPPHLRENQDLQSDDDDVPPHLRDATDDMDTDGIPPHLRQSSPDDIPPHLRNSSPALYSDSKPGFLRDSSPVNEDEGDGGGGGGGGSDDIPPHLRGSSPVQDRDGSSTPKPTSSNKQAQDRMLTSSPPPIPTMDDNDDDKTSKQSQQGQDSDSSDSSDEDGYRQFSYLDIEHLPEKHTKRILEDIDEAERNRKKYRAIAVMTIFLSLEKRGDMEKLYGGQTNAGEKRKGQDNKKEEGGK
ncbi:hypothetical protein TWF281_003979 [Arthrobotrys megalospora]